MTSPQPSQPRPVPPFWPLPVAVFSFGGACCLLSVLAALWAQAQFNLNFLYLMLIVLAAGFLLFGGGAARQKQWGHMGLYGLAAILFLVSAVLEDTHAQLIAPLPEEPRETLEYEVVNVRDANQTLIWLGLGILQLLAWDTARKSKVAQDAKWAWMRLVYAGLSFFIVAMNLGDLWVLLRVLAGR